MKLPGFVVKGLMIAAVCLLAPVAAADEGCEEHQVPAGTPTSHYLLSDVGGDLKMSNLAPSARNHTTWSVTLTSYGDRVEFTKVVQLPLPAYVINEDGKFSGRVNVNAYAKWDRPIGIEMGGYPDFELRMVEGQRSVHLTSGLWYDQFNRGYPGHEPAAPHTHGDGSNASRGLHSSDIALEFVFRLTPGLGTTDLTPSSYQFDVVIDGSSILNTYSLGPVGAAPAPEPEPTGNETSPATPSEPANTDEPAEDAETASGSGTAGAPATAQSQSVPLAPQSASAAPAASQSMLALVGGAAALVVGSVGSVAWMRRPRV